METKHTLIQTDNEATSRITDRNGLAKGYISFKEYYGTIIKLSEALSCDEYIDENIYFRGLLKLGLVCKGKFINRELIEDKDRAYLPTEKEALILHNKYLDTKAEFIQCSIYMSKRGTMGFNLNSPDIVDIVEKPLTKLLCAFNTAMHQKADEVAEAKVLLKSKGLPTNLITIREAKVWCINKYLGGSIS